MWQNICILYDNVVIMRFAESDWSGCPCHRICYRL